MIKTKEIEFFEKKMQDKKYCETCGSKILAKTLQQIKDSTDFKKNLDDNRIGYYKGWSKYNKSG